MELKQVMVVRADLKLPKGKLAAQVAHASVEAALKSDDLQEWRECGQKKVVLKVADQKELIALFQFAKEAGLPCSLITDAGKTVIAPGTKTCIGIGPADEEKIDILTQDLKMV
ncbi:MAG: PTH2 family peptidyl-tRNA hydrolase [Candidatus Woesearchaeota archaeon]|jgi:PTH2 family peptidyl-tRNA hydrolase